MNIKYIITPEIERGIIKLYQEKVRLKTSRCGEAPVKKFAEMHNVPSWKITRHASSLGLIPTVNKEPPWSKAEITILEKHASKVPERIQRHLKLAGYTRSYSAIVVKRKRLHLSAKPEHLSATQVAECFGVDVHTVMRWINRRFLRARRRGTHRETNDTYEIKYNDLREFVITHVCEIDLRKVDKYFFVDLLVKKES